MHVYQMRSSVPSVVAASQERISVCMNALKEVSKVWLVAKMVHTLFESILGNKLLEERLQKATGRKAPRSRKNRDTAESHAATTAAAAAATNNNANSSNNVNLPPAAPPPPAPPAPPSNKRKFDDIDLGFSVGPPVAQVSYERSRPQTPALTPSREITQQQAHENSLRSPPLPNNNDQYLPGRISRGPSRVHSRIGTRANSPFNGFSIPPTPPDLFLVTRNSPPISQQLWENFQPDQLFPDGSIDPTAVNFSSPILNHAAVDPRLQMPTNGSGQQPSPGLTAAQQGDFGSGHGQIWPPGLNGMVGAGMEMRDSDGWSNSSTSNAPIVPTTLNVEDWFQFFGIHGADIASFGVES